MEHVPEQAREHFELSGGVDIARTTSILRYGSGDPSHRRTEDGLWRTSTTPDGPATVRVRVLRAGTQATVEVTGWGPGRAWLVASAPGMLGLTDDASGFAPEHPMLQPLHRRYAGLRIPRTQRVWDSLLAAILSQKITGKEAFGSWRQLLYRAGEPAPGPVPQGMYVPPTPEAVRRLAIWDWHAVGVDNAHRAVILRCAVVAESLERIVGIDHVEAAHKLQTLPGIGIWTAAEVSQRALGDADAPSFGDYHVPGLVGLAFTGRKTDDEGMRELLEPYRPHRSRVVRLIELGGFAQRHGPRRTVPNFRGI